MAQPEPPFRRLARTPTLWIVGAVVLFFGVLSLVQRPETAEEINLSQFWAVLEDGAVRNAELLEGDQVVRGELTDGTEYVVSYPLELADELTTELREADVPLQVTSQKPNDLVQLLYYVLPSCSSPGCCSG